MANEMRYSQLRLACLSLPSPFLFLPLLTWPYFPFPPFSPGPSFLPSPSALCFSSPLLLPPFSYLLFPYQLSPAFSSSLPSRIARIPSVYPVTYQASSSSPCFPDLFLLSLPSLIDDPQSPVLHASHPMRRLLPDAPLTLLQPECSQSIPILHQGKLPGDSTSYLEIVTPKLSELQHLPYLITQDHTSGTTHCLKLLPQYLYSTLRFACLIRHYHYHQHIVTPPSAYSHPNQVILQSMDSKGDPPINQPPKDSTKQLYPSPTYPSSLGLLSIFSHSHFHHDKPESTQLSPDCYILLHSHASYSSANSVQSASGDCFPSLEIPSSTHVVLIPFSPLFIPFSPLFCIPLLSFHTLLYPLGLRLNTFQCFCLRRVLAWIWIEVGQRVCLWVDGALRDGARELVDGNTSEFVFQCYSECADVLGTVFQRITVQETAAQLFVIRAVPLVLRKVVTIMCRDTSCGDTHSSYQCTLTHTLIQYHRFFSTAFCISDLSFWFFSLISSTCFLCFSAFSFSFLVYCSLVVLIVPLSSLTHFSSY